MEVGVLRRALRFVAAGGFLVAIDIHVAGFDVLSDTVGLALAFGGLCGLMRLPAAGETTRAQLRVVQVITLLAMLGSAFEELRPDSFPMAATVAVRIAPLVALNGLCLAMWRLNTVTGRPRAAEAWRTTFSAVVTMLDVPAAVLVAAIAAGRGSLPTGTAGVALGVVGGASALLPLLHLLAVSTPRTVEPLDVRLAPVIDLRPAVIAASNRSEVSGR